MSCRDDLHQNRDYPYLQTIEQLPRTPTNKVIMSQLRSAAGDCWDRKEAGVALLDLAQRAAAYAVPTSSKERS